MDLDLANLTLRPSKRLNIVFVGHVDAGKSTICGRILSDLKIVDARTLEKYREQAAEMNRGSWYLSWCMDQNPEERERGKTSELSTASFDLPHTRVNILDTPGHKQFISEMIDASSRADVGVLIVSARTSEFEAGFQGGGQTKEHLLLLKSAGVSKLVVLVNKMDECDWSEERFKEIKNKIGKYIRHIFPDSHFIPICGTSGTNVSKRMPTPIYDGPTFLEYLDSLDIQRRTGKACATVVEKLKVSGSALLRVMCDTGSFSRGSLCKILPLNRGDKLTALANDDDVDVERMEAGENYKVKLDAFGDEVLVGMKLVDPSSDEYVACSELYAHLIVLEVSEAVTVGYMPIMHLGSQAIGCKVTGIFSFEKKKVKVARSGDRVVVRLKLESKAVVSCMPGEKERFSLRDKGTTVASGWIRKIVS